MLNIHVKLHIALTLNTEKEGISDFEGLNIFKTTSSGVDLSTSKASC